MKQVFILALCCALLIASIPLPVYASAANISPVRDVFSTTSVLENGIIVIDEIIIESSARATNKDATRTRSFYDGDTLIATISVQAAFRYDGSTVSVVSKTVTQTDTYSGWSFSQDSFTSSGDTVTLEGKLKFLLLFRSTPVSISLSCDKNGNISY